MHKVAMPSLWFEVLFGISRLSRLITVRATAKADAPFSFVKDVVFAPREEVLRTAFTGL
jgi:hypothetical protein